LFISDYEIFKKETVVALPGKCLVIDEKDEEEDIMRLQASGAYGISVYTLIDFKALLFILSVSETHQNLHRTISSLSPSLSSNVRIQL
jgi:hypothetical protein